MGAASPTVEADENPFLQVCSLLPVLTGSVPDPGDPLWLAKLWYAEIISLPAARPLQLALCRDLLSEAVGQFSHTHPELWRLHANLLRGPI